MSGKRKWRHDSPMDALFAQERDVLELWDAGETAESIAATLKIGTHQVKNIVNLFDDCRANEFARAADALRGSTALADAILATGGMFR